jgi:hypothetical protein
LEWNHYIIYELFSFTTMNGRKQKYPDIVLVVVLVSSSLFFMTASLGATIIIQTTDGQRQAGQQNAINTTGNNSMFNQTGDIANQSSAVVGSMQNQTSVNQTQPGTAALLANLTKGDFESLKEDLTEARQALENNETTTVLDELNSASGELFQITSSPFDPAHVEAMTQEFNQLQTHIDQAQEQALKDDHAGALGNLSFAESELLKITQTLPPSQE